MAGFTSYIIENDIEFANKLGELGRRISDFSPAFKSISLDFFKSNRLIFKLKSRGQYPELADSTIARKKKLLGSAYPIFSSKRNMLKKSLTSRSDSNAELDITKSDLAMGTKVPHAIYHQSDKLPRTQLPQRKIIFIDGGPLETSKGANISGRAQRWLNILEGHAQQVLEGAI